MLHDIITYLPMFTTLFWAIILLSTREEHGRAKIIFGIFMSAAFLLYTSHAVFFQKLENIYLFFDPIYTFATLVVYPIYYWYIKQLTTDKEYDFTNLYLLIPGTLLSLLTAIIYILMDSGERTSYINEFLYTGITEFTSPLIKAQIYTYITARVSFAIIIVYVFVKGQPIVKKHNQKIANSFSNLRKKTIHWVNGLLNTFIFISILCISINFIGRSIFLDSTALLAIPSLLFSILFFLLGYLAYHQQYDISNLDLEGLEDLKTPAPEDRINNELFDQLNFQFNECKIYRQKELKITDIAGLLNTNRTYISNLINQEHNYSFNEYVNRYRTTEAKELIKNAPNEPLELIAIKVGYGSLSTFFRTFKLHEGMTPNQFRRFMLNKEEVIDS